MRDPQLPLYHTTCTCTCTCIYLCLVDMHVLACTTYYCTIVTPLTLTYPPPTPGILLGEAAIVTEASMIKRFWVHEVMRVYYDRLVDDSDRSWLFSNLKETMQTEFNTNFDELFKKLDVNQDGESSVLTKKLWSF